MAPPSLMYKGNKVPLPGVKLPMRGFNHAKVKEKLDIYPLPLTPCLCLRLLLGAEVYLYVYLGCLKTKRFEASQRFRKFLL